MIEAMPQVHMSEAEVAKNFVAVLERVRQGVEVVIERDARPVALLKPSPEFGRLISESIAIAKAREEETGETPVLDPDFAADVEEIVRNRQPWDPPAWD